MCLVAVAIGQSPRWAWVIASNRDEFFDRASTPLAWWRPEAGGVDVLSGRDLAGGGTWLGLARSGRLALVTNVREPGRYVAGLPSRGELVTQWLMGDATPLASTLAVPRNGYNLLRANLLDGTLDWGSNRLAQQSTLGPGLYGLSNAALDTPWPKTLRLKAALQQTLSHHPGCSARDLNAALLPALADAEPAPDDQLPDTGVGLERERQISSAFIRVAGGVAGYGTRCSTVVAAETLGDGLRVHVFERSFDFEGRVVQEAEHCFVPQHEAAT